MYAARANVFQAYGDKQRCSGMHHLRVNIDNLKLQFLRSLRHYYAIPKPHDAVAFLCAVRIVGWRDVSWLLR